MKIQESLKSVWIYLEGKKSYVIAFLFVVLAGLKAEGYITNEAYEAIVALLGGLGIAALRHGMSK